MMYYKQNKMNSERTNDQEKSSIQIKELKQNVLKKEIKISKSTAKAFLMDLHSVQLLQ